MKYAIIHGKPCPADMLAELDAIADATGLTYTSLLRTQDAVDHARARGHKLSSQAELRSCYLRGVPGCNPANPVGRSTHELRNDGVAFRGPMGMALRHWQLGIDSSNARALIREGTARGWRPALTYPHNPRESHHVNFRAEPIFFAALRKGDRGRRVKAMTTLLRDLRSPYSWDRYLPHRYTTFGAVVRDALERFQDEHELEADGILGAQSANQLDVSMRRQKSMLGELASDELGPVKALLRERDRGRGGEQPARDIEDWIKSDRMPELRQRIAEAKQKGDLKAVAWRVGRYRTLRSLHPAFMEDDPT